MKTRFLALFILLLSVFSISPSKALFGHSITNLRLSTDPVRPNTGDSFTLELSFKLVSPSGVQFNRIKISQNDTLIQTGAADFGLTRLSPTEAIVSFSRLNFTSTGAITDNEIKIEYLLTSDPDSKVLASKKIKLKTSNPDNGSNDDGSNGGKDKGDKGKTAIPKTDIVRLEVEIISADLLVDQVSEIGKMFSVTIDHNNEFIPGEEVETFDDESSLLLNTLTIESIDRNGERSDFKNSLIFDLPSSSRSSPGSSSLTETVFLSGEKILKEAQSLEFKINVNPFLKSVNVSLDKNTSNLRADATLVIKPRTLELNADPTIGFTSLFFEPRKFDVANPAEGEEDFEYKLSSEEFNINTSLTTTEFTSIEADALGFVDFNKDTPTLPSLDFGDELKGLVELNGNGDLSRLNLSQNENTFTFDYPARLFLNLDNSIALKRRELFSTSSQMLDLPISIFTKDENDLDVSFSRTVSSIPVTVQILDDPIFTNASGAAKRNKANTAMKLVFKYSNYVGKNVDPLDLEIDFLDDANTILGTSTLRAFSKLKDKSITSKGKVQAVKKFKKTLREDDLEGGLSAFLAQATKIKIRIKRDATYLSSFGLSYDADSTRDSLLFTNRNEKEIILK